LSFEDLDRPVVKVAEIIAAAPTAGDMAVVGAEEETCNSNPMVWMQLFKRVLNKQA